MSASLTISYRLSSLTNSFLEPHLLLCPGLHILHIILQVKSNAISKSCIAPLTCKSLREKRSFVSTRLLRKPSLSSTLHSTHILGNSPDAN